MLGKFVIFIPLNASIFSSGVGGGLYGYATSSGYNFSNVAGNNLGIGIFATYYQFLGEGPAWDKKWKELYNKFR